VRDLLHLSIAMLAYAAFGLAGEHIWVFNEVGNSSQWWTAESLGADKKAAAKN